MTTTLTLLHGFMGDPTDWDQIRADLSDCDIVTPTIRPAADWQTGIQRILAEAPERSTWVGYSMGARLSLACALEAPQRCAALVFVSGNPGLDEAARIARLQHDLQVAERVENEPRREFLARWYAQPVFSSLSADMARDEIERKIAQSGDDWGQILRTYSIGRQPDFWPRLGDLPCPILAVAGQHDVKYVDIAMRMSQIANCQARIIPSSGHIVHREQPRALVQTLREFLTPTSCACRP